MSEQEPQAEPTPLRLADRGRRVEPLPRLSQDDAAMADQIGDMIGDRAAEIIQQERRRAKPA